MEIVKLRETTQIFNHLQNFSCLKMDFRSNSQYNQIHMRGSINVKLVEEKLPKDMQGLINTHLRTPSYLPLSKYMKFEIFILIGKKRNLVEHVKKILEREFKGKAEKKIIHLPSFDLILKKYPFLFVKKDQVFSWMDKYPNEILEDFLYLGNRHQCKKYILDGLKITNCINTAEEVQCSVKGDSDPPQFLYCKNERIKDNLKGDLYKMISTCLKFIRECKRKKERVFVHCNQGVSRSSSIVIAYLIVESKMSYNEAYKHVKQCRFVIEPNPSFVSQLKKLEGNTM